MADQRRAATLDILREVMRTHDLRALGAVLADDVRWQNCRSRDELLATLRTQLAAAPPAPLDARLEGEWAVLRMTLPGLEGESLVAFALDDDGQIKELRHYSGEAALEHDLALVARGPQGTPAPQVHRLVPFVHVADMARSVAFYALLGLEQVSTYEPGGALAWAFLESRGGAQLMLARGDWPIDHDAQAVLFYLYVDDLTGLRDHLVAHGVAANEIHDGTPGPKEEMRVFDPDGFVVMIARSDPDP